MIRQSPTKALEKEKEESRVMRAAFEKGELDQGRKRFIERKTLFKKEDLCSEKRR